jgi:hypothetical protein
VGEEKEMRQGSNDACGPDLAEGKRGVRVRHGSGRGTLACSAGDADRWAGPMVGDSASSSGTSVADRWVRPESNAKLDLNLPRN